MYTDDEVKREMVNEMLEDAALCFSMAAQPIPNAKIYGKIGRGFQLCANRILLQERDEELLRQCLEECPL